MVLKLLPLVITFLLQAPAHEERDDACRGADLHRCRLSSLPLSPSTAQPLGAAPSRRRLKAKIIQFSVKYLYCLVVV
jgi:hypothetical protein